MAITIGSNIASLNAQRGLAQASEALTRTCEKLSSGQRINRAADDAAGLAIASGLKATTNIESQALRNISDGISALEVASQALGAQQEILERMFELAGQSANSTYSFVQRKSMQKEYSQLLKEYERIGRTAEFNGIKLLDGSTQAISIQSGANGSVNAGLAVALADTSNTGGEEWFHCDIDTSGFIDSFDGALFNAYANRSTAGGRFTQPFTIDGLGEVAQGGIQTISVQDSSGVEREVYVAINPTQGISLGNNVAQAIFFIADAQGNFKRQSTLTIYQGQANACTFAFTDTGAQASLTIDLRNVAIKSAEYVTNLPSPVGSRRTALSFTGVEGSGHARVSMDTIKNRMEDLGQVSGLLGAAQSRLETQFNTMSAMRLEHHAASGRITDADVAQESANLARQQILQQAGSAVLGQANQQPALALQLLRS